MPAEGVAGVQVTRHGGVNAYESDDGRALLFTQIDSSGADLMLLENVRRRGRRNTPGSTS